MRKVLGPLAMELQYTAGAVSSVRAAEARRGPNRSQADPIATLANTAPETAAIPAFPISVAVRSRSSRMIGSRGGAAKVETKQAKKEIQDRWNARMCGAATENRRNSVALCSESTGSANFFRPDSSVALKAGNEMENMLDL